MNIIRVLLSVIFLVFAIMAFYLIYPAFTTTTINDPFPIIATGAKLSQLVEGGVNVEMSAQIRQTGMFKDEGKHHAEGVATIIELEDTTHALRLENFVVTNGPALYVYVVTPGDPEPVWHEIGKLKASNGSQNYRIPPEIQVTDITEVLIYCKPFRTIFGRAIL